MACPVDPNQSLNKLNPFKLAKAIHDVVKGKIHNVTRLSSGHILLETYSHSQTQALLEAKTFNEIPVKITPHKSLTFVKGVIKTPDLQHCTTEESTNQNC